MRTQEIIPLYPMKTASFTIQKGVLEKIGQGKYNPNHRFPEDIVKDVGLLRFQQAYKIFFSRNPYNRIVGFYEFSKRMKKSRGQPTRTFEEFVNSPYDTWKDANGSHVRRQCDYLYLDGKMIVDYFGRFEFLIADIRKLLLIFEVPNSQTIEVPHLLLNKHPHYLEYYKNNNFKEKIYEVFKEDFKFFGYSK